MYISCLVTLVQALLSLGSDGHVQVVQRYYYYFNNLTLYSRPPKVRVRSTPTPVPASALARRVVVQPPDQSGVAAAVSARAAARPLPEEQEPLSLLDAHVSMRHGTDMVLSSIPGWEKCCFHQEFLSNSHGVWICARLMTIGSPPIARDFKT